MIAMFKSHFISMLVYALIVSVILAFIKHDDKKAIFQYWVRLFLYMVLGVVAFSWFMYLV
jgi:hypothetical protein